MILVSGTTGFIGSALLNRLIDLYGKANIIALTSKKDERVRCILHNNYHFEEKSFKVDNLKYDFVIHAGAFTPKSNQESNDVTKCYSNISNTHGLLNIIKDQAKRFIFLSTLDVYKPINSIINENTPIEPVSLYGYSKLYCEKMVLNWGVQNNIDVKILRIGHVYGPGEEKYKKLVPEIMRKLISEKEIEVWGDGSDIRSLIYIDDVVEAVINSIDTTSDVNTFNVVSDKGYPIIEIINKIINISKKTVEINFKKITTEPRNLLFNNSLMKEHLYNPSVEIDEGLTKEWKHINKVHD